MTDQPERFFVSEIVREQVLQLTHDELPFSTAVVVDRFEEPGEEQVCKLYCTILVERESQKPIVIGKGGAMIKKIGTAARAELERYFDARVYLDLHVKVKIRVARRRAGPRRNGAARTVTGSGSSECATTLDVTGVAVKKLSTGRNRVLN